MNSGIYKDYVQDASIVIKKYPIQVLFIKKHLYKTDKAVWFIKATDNNYALKRYLLDKDQWKIMISAYNYLSQGVNNVAPLIKTSEGQPWFIYDQHYYILTNWVKGKMPNYNDSEDLVKLTRGIAQLHLAAKDYKVPEIAPRRQYLGNWPLTTRRKQGLLLEYKYEAEADASNLLSKLYLKHYQKYFELYEEVAEVFESKIYTEWVKKIHESPCLCVNGFSPHNFSLEEKGAFWLLHLDNICLDLPARDIRKLIYKTMYFRKNWSLETLDLIIQNYLDIYPLSKDELKILMAELKAPHLFLNSSSNYFLKLKPLWSQEKFKTQFVEVLKFEQNKLETLSRFR